MRTRTTLAPLAMVLGVGMTGVACGGGQGSTDDSGTSMYALSTSQFKNHQTFAVTQSGCQLDTGIPVLKGDIVRTLASGTINGAEGGGFNGSGGTVWTPNGDTEFGGVLGLRFLYGLYGCIGQSVVFLGDDQVFTAPESGTIKLAINGYNAPLTGQYNVDIYTLPTVTVATKPSILDNTRGSAQTVSVDALAGWVHTGINLKRGQKTFIDAAGTVTNSEMTTSGYTTTTYTPDGWMGAWAGTLALLINRAPYRLYAQVGENIVDVGSHAAFQAPTNGELLFAVNNYPANDTNGVVGTFAASVSLGVVPGRDLTPEDLLSFTQHDTVPVTVAGGWATANIHVEAGDPLFVQATGAVTDTTTNKTFGPFGDPNSAGGGAAGIGLLTTYALFGSLGSEIEYVGGQDVYLAPTSAQLKLIINASASRGDTGQFTATVAAP